MPTQMMTDHIRSYLCNRQFTAKGPGSRCVCFFPKQIFSVLPLVTNSKIASSLHCNEVFIEIVIRYPTVTACHVYQFKIDTIAKYSQLTIFVFIRSTAKRCNQRNIYNYWQFLSKYQVIWCSPPTPTCQKKKQKKPIILPKKPHFFRKKNT